MPTRNIEAIDDPPLFDASPGFAGGLNDYVRRSRISEQQYAVGENVMITKAGLAQTRRGTQDLWTQLWTPAEQPLNRWLGMGWFNKSDGQQALIMVASVSNGTAWVMRWSDGVVGNTYGQPTIPGAPDVNAFVSIVQGLDKVYFSNGVDVPMTWDGTASPLSALGAGATDFPKAKYITWFTNRMIAAGIATKPDTVAFSDILDPSNTHWSAANTIRVGAGDGDEITGIVPWTGTLLLVFKKSSVWVVDVNPLTTVAQFQITRIHSGIGCVAHRSIVQVGTDVWFLSREGVRSVRRVLQGAENEVSLPLSLPVQNRLARINQDAWATSCAAYINNRYILGFPAGSNTMPSEALVFNTELQQWESWWSGLAPHAMQLSYFGGAEKLNLCDATARVLRWLHYIPETSENAASFEDYGNAIPAVIGLRSHSFGEPLNQKRGFAVEFEFNNSLADVVTLKANPDEAAAGSTLATITTVDASPINRKAYTLLHQAPFREIAFEVSSTGKKLALRGVSVSAFLQTMPVGQ